MRSSPLRRCPNLRALGLDSQRTYTAVEIKAAFVRQAKSAHPDAGGDAAAFRRLKDAYDALRSPAGEGTAAGATAAPSYPDPYANRSSAASARRAHIYEERRSDDGTWDFGSGRRYANESTRHFYRPYSANYADPRSTGFSRQEVVQAERAMRLHLLKRVLWNCLVYLSAAYLLYEYWRQRTRQPRPDSLEPSYSVLEKAPQPRPGLAPLQPHLQPHWSESQTARYLSEWNARHMEREQSGGTPRTPAITAPRSTAVADGNAARTVPRGEAATESPAHPGSAGYGSRGAVAMEMDDEADEDLEDEEVTEVDRA